MVSDPDEVGRLRREVEEFRVLVRELSASLAAVVARLPLDAALALVRRGDATEGRPFQLADWHETVELTRAEVEAEMMLLWKRLPPRETT